MIERAIQIYEAKLGPDHYRVGIGLNNLGDLHREAGRLDTAEPYYRRALEIFQGALGPEHINVSFPLKGLADLCRDSDRRREADEFYRRALAIREKTLPPDNEMLKTTKDDYQQFLEMSE